MTPLIALALAVAAVLVVAAAAWSVMRRAPWQARVWLRGLLVLVALLAAPEVAELSRSLVGRGLRQCDLCGRLERVETLAGVRLVRRPYADAECAEALDAYAAWIAPLLGEHEHAWTRVGCWYRGSTVSCSMRRPVEPWHVHLPHVADQALAERAARAVLSAEPVQRRAWLEMRDPAVPDRGGDCKRRNKAERQACFEQWLRAVLGAR